MSNSKGRPARLRKQAVLLKIYGNACFWCGDPMALVPHQTLRGKCVSFDELLPRSRGGLREIRNQVLAHARCNSLRGNMIAPAVAIARHLDMLRSHGILPVRNDLPAPGVLSGANHGGDDG